MIESIPIQEFNEILEDEARIRYTRQVGGYLWVSIDPEKRQVNDCGIAQSYGWVIVAVDFGYQAVLFAPIDHLRELRPAQHVIDDVRAGKEDSSR